jgi:hypothetical protein
LIAPPVRSLALAIALLASAAVQAHMGALNLCLEEHKDG